MLTNYLYIPCKICQNQFEIVEGFLVCRKPFTIVLSNVKVTDYGEVKIMGKVFINNGLHVKLEVTNKKLNKPKLVKVLDKEDNHDHWELIDSDSGKILWTEKLPIMGPGFRN